MGSLYSEVRLPSYIEHVAWIQCLLVCFFLARKECVRGKIQQKYFVAVRTATTTAVPLYACVGGEGETEQPLPSAFSLQVFQDKNCLRGALVLVTKQSQPKRESLPAVFTGDREGVRVYPLSRMAVVA